MQENWLYQRHAEFQRALRLIFSNETYHVYFDKGPNFPIFHKKCWRLFVTKACLKNFTSLFHKSSFLIPGHPDACIFNPI